MKQERLEQLICEYVMGTIARPEREELEAYLAQHPKERKRLAEAGVVATHLLFAAEPVPPRPEVKETIRAKIAPRKKRAAEVKPQSPFFFLKADEGAWQTIRHGVTAKVLFADQKRNVTTMLVRMEPGTVFPNHTHGGPEELYVLEGDCVCLGVELGPGDYHRAAEGTEHGETSTREGCLMLVISPELTFHD